MFFIRLSLMLMFNFYLRREFRNMEQEDTRQNISLMLGNRFTPSIPVFRRIMNNII